MLHDPKTVIGSDFDQETAEKIAPQFIPRLELANCMYVLREVEHKSHSFFFHFFCKSLLLPSMHVFSSQAGLRADGAGESALPAEEASSAGSANSENSTR